MTSKEVTATTDNPDVTPDRLDYKTYAKALVDTTPKVDRNSLDHDSVIYANIEAVQKQLHIVQNNTRLSEERKKEIIAKLEKKLDEYYTSL